VLLLVVDSLTVVLAALSAVERQELAELLDSPLSIEVGSDFGVENPPSLLPAESVPTFAQ
jgi:hypothetical protein